MAQGKFFRMCSVTTINTRQAVSYIGVAVVALFILGMYTDVINPSSLVGDAYGHWIVEEEGSEVNGWNRSLIMWNETKHWQIGEGNVASNQSTGKANLTSLNATEHFGAFQAQKNGTEVTSQGRLKVNVMTTLTSNSSVVVHCTESPYIECSPPTKPRSGDQLVRIVVLRRPYWLISPDFSACASRCLLDGETVDSITEKTDVVHVYGVGLNSNFKPPPRWPHQLYVVSTWESPIFTHADFLQSKSSVWNLLFNLTISYRVDSDVFIPYSKLRFQPLPPNKRPNYYDISTKKTRTAVWLVSHCGAPSKRSEYVSEMQKYIDVDIFGACGKPCSTPTVCMDSLNTTYKFYLSFENSLCTDYITEKLFKIYEQGLHVIPVVRGAANYDNYFPNFTYINAAHFKTAKDLALHLKTLASDLETYSKYLEYKDMYHKTDEGIGDVACKLCDFLHTPRNSPKVYDMKEWMGEGQCHGANDIT